MVGGVVGREGVRLKVGEVLLGYSWGGCQGGTDRGLIPILVRFGGEVLRGTCVMQGLMGGVMDVSRLNYMMEDQDRGWVVKYIF